MKYYEKGVEKYQPEQHDPCTARKIEALKEALKDELVILGHHYQRDNVIRYADIRGDSLILSRKAAEMEKKHVVFCGVYFMAECADILSAEDQKVYLPDLQAGCSMADMADREAVEAAWEHLTSLSDATIIPVTYINSSADIKAFVGKHGGIVCTSSNAPKIFDWAMEKGDKILFLPDRYLGLNTALSKGVSREEIRVLDTLPDRSGIKKARVLLWNGYCSVHKYFEAEHVHALRERFPGIRIVVHGECKDEVVRESDHFGSTSTIIDLISASPKGSTWGVGTEEHLVRRLQRQFPDKTVMSLSEPGFQCATMSMITPGSLLQVLEEIRAGRDDHRVRVQNEIKSYAKTALIRMLAL
ncbi:MAG: quinolinate synthase NadA [Candidatus Marinimicrobia bacterium]|nr:quinolinate synthase NadA [Candidatus Neomarinimicrobiota bacterium]